PLLLARGAMLVREDTTFSGPYREPLGILGRELAANYRPVHAFLAGLPSLVAYPVMTSGYESAAQFSVADFDVEVLSRQFGIPQETLAYELGRQSILGNVAGYLRLSLVHYVGQWSIMALKLPPTAAAINDYAARYPKQPLEGLLGDVFLRPVGS